jgi:hemerythrin-like metal-binding protein
MEQIELASGFTVGCPRMDYPHVDLVRLLNLMLRSDGTVVNSEEFTLFLTRATEYAAIHFREEEQLMANAGYPGLAGHRKSHTDYRKRIAEFCLRTMDRHSNVPAELLNFLMEWWRHHILVEDAGYKPYIQKATGE